MTKAEQNIINSLLAGDDEITHVFFFRTCRPMLSRIVYEVFKNNAEYDEVVNELYSYLLEKNGERLRSFKGGDEEDENNIAALISWIKVTANRLFVGQNKKEKNVNENRKRVLDEDGEEVDVEAPDTSCQDPGVKMDAKTLLNLLPPGREKEVLTDLFLNDLDYEEIAEKFGTSIDNLYNIKKRALGKLKEKSRHATGFRAICSAICEQFVMDVFGIHYSIDDLCDESRRMGWLTDTGVAMENVGALCKEHGLAVRSGEASGFDSIEQAIEKDAQVIAVIDGGELNGSPLEEFLEDILAGGVSDHCVVVLTMDENTVTLYDPALGTVPLIITRERFIDAWEDSGKFMAEIQKGLN